MTDGQYKLPNGTILHIWTQEDKRWVCASYAHGPLCRRCEQCDDIMEALLENVLDGLMEVKDDIDRGLLFHLTEEGKTRVEHMIDENRP